MSNISMRDSFFDELYPIAMKDKNLIIISADMGAPGLDKFRENLAGQFVNVGIAEQNMINIATGLALEGKKVFVYAIMPFATLRCYEIIKVNLAIMNIPVTIIGIGAGFSYDDSGATHHSTEDISVMRVLPNMTILSPSDSIMAAWFARISCQMTTPNYVRLDREVLPLLYQPNTAFTAGLANLRTGDDVCIIATGNMVHIALEVSDKLKGYSIHAKVIDLYQIKPINQMLLLHNLERVKRIVTLEEHLLIGGMGSAVIETLADNGKAIPIKRVGIQDRYLYVYGGRQILQSACGLDANSVTETISVWLRGK